MHKFRLLSCTLLLLIPPLFSQQRVAPRNMHHRLLCIVPIIGSGAPDDPRRPMFAPTGEAISRDGIIGYSMQIGDDKQVALVEFIARDQKAFAEILASRRTDVKVFIKGRNSKAEIEAEFRKFKKDFDLDRFGVDLQ